jgi:carboxymethylenebutenolidase
MKLALRLFPALFLAALLAPTLAVRADGPKTDTVQFPAGKETASGFLATPEKPGRYPGLIVIHEWWGLNDWVKGQTEKLAAEGYVALAVDLYHGQVATNPDDAEKLTQSVQDDQAIADLNGAFTYLAGRSDVDHDHIGAIGWSMGGAYALEFAMNQPRLSACVVNYGTLPTDPTDIMTIYAPVLGNFGADDHGVTPEDVNSFEKSMTTLRRRVDIKIFDGAGHGFENPNNTAGYRPAAAAEAWTRTINFLNKMLR